MRTEEIRVGARVRVSENRGRRMFMRAKVSVKETAEETLARQAMALIQRSGEPLLETPEAALKTPAERHPEEVRGDPHQDEDLLFPSFNYYLDESDPDILMLRREDDTFVAAFSARGATREGIVEAAREDYKSVLKRLSGGRKDEAANMMQ